MSRCLKCLRGTAGTGQFLDSDAYDLIEAGPDVTKTAAFVVRLSGDSMKPLFKDHSIVWVYQQNSVLSGETGIRSNKKKGTQGK